MDLAAQTRIHYNHLMVTPKIAAEVTAHQVS